MRAALMVSLQRSASPARRRDHGRPASSRSWLVQRQSGNAGRPHPNPQRRSSLPGHSCARDCRIKRSPRSVVIIRSEPAFWVRSAPSRTQRRASYAVAPRHCGRIRAGARHRPPPRMRNRPVVVDDAEGLHRRVHGCWSTKRNPRLRRSLDSAVDSAVLAGSSENFLGGALTGSYCQINEASDSPDCRNSSTARALAMVASILPRFRTIPASPRSRPGRAHRTRRPPRCRSRRRPPKFSRLRRIVSHDKPLWKPSRQSSRRSGGRRPRAGPTRRRGTSDIRLGSPRSIGRRRHGRSRRQACGHHPRSVEVNHQLHRRHARRVLPPEVESLRWFRCREGVPKCGSRRHERLAKRSQSGHSALRVGCRSSRLDGDDCRCRTGHGGRLVDGRCEGHRHGELSRRCRA